LPGIVFYAEHAYSEKVEMDVGLVKSKFDAVCGGCFDDFVFASKMDDLQPDNKFVDDKACVSSLSVIILCVCVFFPSFDSSSLALFFCFWDTYRRFTPNLSKWLVWEGTLFSHFIFPSENHWTTQKKNCWLKKEKLTKKWFLYLC
jgi:hypothetical protein